MAFSKLLLERANVAVSPGIGFGEYGEGYVYGAKSPVPTVHETLFGDVHLRAVRPYRSIPITRSARFM